MWKIVWIGWKNRFYISTNMDGPKNNDENEVYYVYT